MWFLPLHISGSSNLLCWSCVWGGGVSCACGSLPGSHLAFARCPGCRSPCCQSPLSQTACLGGCRWFYQGLAWVSRRLSSLDPQQGRVCRRCAWLVLCFGHVSRVPGQLSSVAHQRGCVCRALHLVEPQARAVVSLVPARLLSVAPQPVRRCASLDVGPQQLSRALGRLLPVTPQPGRVCWALRLVAPRTRPWVWVPGRLLSVAPEPERVYQVVYFVGC